MTSRDEIGVWEDLFQIWLRNMEAWAYVTKIMKTAEQTKLINVKQT